MRLLAVFMMVGSSAIAADAPQRIVSMSLCADQWLLALAKPEQIAALSPLAADEHISWQWQRAVALNHVAPNAEAIMALKPDLVVFDSSSSAILEQKIKSYGIATYRLPEAKTMADLSTITTDFAAAIGADSSKMEADFSALAEKSECHDCKPAALLWDGNYAGGSGVIADLFSRAGFRLIGAGWMDAEKIAYLHKRDGAIIIRADNYGDMPSVAEERGKLVSNIPTMKIDARKIICSGPSLLSAWSEISEAH